MRMEGPNTPENKLSSKKSIRELYTNKLLNLSEERKKQASNNAFKALSKLAIKDINIISFASFSFEINIWVLNKFLLKTSKLFLPKLIDQEIKIFQIHDISHDLKENSLGFLEPVKACKPYEVSKRDIIFAPGLCFDSYKNRIGRGKGHYDRFLKKHKIVKSFGIGYLEQMYPKPLRLPIENHDVKLFDVFLF